MSGVGLQPEQQQRTGAAAPQWHALACDIARWRALPDDWDGEGGVRPASVVLDAAADFLRRAQAAGAPLPHPFIAGDGEVGFRWRRDDAFASAAFLPDGHMVAVCDLPGQIVKLDRPYAHDLDLSALYRALWEFA